VAQALPEAMPIAGGYVCFYDEKVDMFEVEANVWPE
jgi:hypothetical protein